MVKNVAILGLGKMGGAIATLLAQRGVSVAGWSRSPKKPDASPPYVVYSDIEHATANAEVIFFLTPDYTAAVGALAKLVAADLVRGKTVISAPSGSPDEAIDFARLVRNAGGMPLDCAIMGYPSDLGSERIYLLYSGDKKYYNQTQQLLLNIGPNQVFVGEGYGTAKAIDFGLLSRSYSWLFGYFQSLILVQDQGVDAMQFAELAANIIGPFQANLLRSTQAIVANEFGPAKEASLDVHHAALSKIIGRTRGRNIHLAMPELCLEVIKQSLFEGRGECDIAAVYPALIRISQHPRKDSFFNFDQT